MYISRLIYSPSSLTHTGSAATNKLLGAATCFKTVWQTLRDAKSCMEREGEWRVPSHEVFYSSYALVLRQRAGRFVDDGANYENGNHNATKMEAI